MSIFDYFKDKNFSTALNDFDKTITSMPFRGNQTSKDSNTDAIGDIMDALNDDGSNADGSKKGSQSQTTNDEVADIFKDLEIPQDRINRFHLYDSIYNNVQIVKRVITVYLNNIFLSNTISNEVYTLSSKEGVDESESDIAKKFAHSFIKKNKLISRLKHDTVADMLIYGDSFIELIDIEDVKVHYPINHKSKKESEKDKKDIENIQESDAYNHADEESKSDIAFLERMALRDSSSYSDKDLEDLVSIMTNFETSPSISDQESNNYTLLQEANNRGNKKDNGVSSLDRLLIKFHSPIKLIPLESPYGIILGYLEVGTQTIGGSSGSHMNPMASFLSTVNALGGHQTSRKKKTISTSYSQLADALIRKLFQKNNIVKSKHGDAKKIQADYIASIESKIKPELMHAVKKILVTAGKSDISHPRLNIRFIKPNRVFHFKYPGAKSVVDTLVYPGKLYLLIQLTNIISRISRSSSVRKWNLDIGTRENSSAVIRNLRNSLRNQRITASDMTTRDISKVMTDFKDLVTVSRNGKSFVDVDLIQMGDPSVSTQDLEFQRNEIVAVSGIPASYLGYNDTYELRDQLVHANISFANEIIGVQTEVNEKFNDLLVEAGRILGKDKIAESITFSLTPPMVLMLQVIEATMQSFGTVYSQLKDTMEIKTDPVQMLNKFVPYANWKEIIDAGKVFENKKAASKDPAAADAGGFG